jgi:hypothetical protein
MKHSHLERCLNGSILTIALAYAGRFTREALLTILGVTITPEHFDARNHCAYADAYLVLALIVLVWYQLRTDKCGIVSVCAQQLPCEIHTSSAWLARAKRRSCLACSLTADSR